MRCEHKGNSTMKTITTASLALLLASVAAPALAQSGPVDWSGAYVGIHGGYLNNADEDESLLFDRDFDGQYDDTVVTVAGANAFSPGSCNGSPNSTSQPAGCDSDKDGAEAGIRAGYDMQFGSFVIGALGEISATESEDSVTSFSTTPASYTFERKLRYLAAARLRLGYAYGPALIYATGGYASGKIDNQFYSSNTGNAYTANIDEDDAEGPQYGGGIEYALAPNLTVTGEYLYSDLDTGDFSVRFARGSQPATNPFILPPNTAGTDVIRSNDAFKMHAFRIGMNYRF